MAFTFLMDPLLRPSLLITAADPVGPGLPCADPSVNISIDLSEVPGNYLCTLLYFPYHLAVQLLSLV